MHLALLVSLQLGAAASPPINPVFDGCPAGRLDSTVRAEIINAVDQANGRLNSAIQEALLQAARSCAADRGWNEGDIRRAASAIGPQIMRQEARRALEQAGIDTGILDRWFAAQPASFRTQSRLANGGAAQIYQGLRAAGLSHDQLMRTVNPTMDYFVATGILELLSAAPIR